MTHHGPTYDLVRVRELAAAKSYRITGVAIVGSGELGLDEAAIVDCVTSLDAACFHKTMEAEKRPGLWQDVYLPTFQGFDLYVKVQIVDERPDEKLVVISFKRR